MGSPITLMFLIAHGLFLRFHVRRAFGTDAGRNFCMVNAYLKWFIGSKSNCTVLLLPLSVSVLLSLQPALHPVLDADEHIVIRTFDIDDKAVYVADLSDGGGRRTDEKAPLRKIPGQQGKPLCKRRSRLLLRRSI